MTKKYVRVIGVDVSSEKLDLHDSAGKLNLTIENTCEAVNKIARAIKDCKDTLVVCEATGAYEYALVAAMRKLLTILNDMVRRGEAWRTETATQ